MSRSQYAWEGTHRLPTGEEVSIEVRVSYCDPSMGGGIMIDHIEGIHRPLTDAECDALADDAALLERIDDAWRDDMEERMR